MRLECLETRQVLAGGLGDPVAVLFKPTATPAQIAAATSTVAGSTPEKIVLRATPSNYGQLYRFDLRPGISADSALATLKASPYVKIAQRDNEYKPAFTSNDPAYLSGDLWGAYSSPAAVNGLVNQFGTQADTVWGGTTNNVGSNSVVVGIIDSGIDISHPDLAPNVWVNPGEIAGNNLDDDGNGYVDDIHGWDFANDDNTVFDGGFAGDGIDDHGTHVAGTIGAKGGNGIGVAGVNWDVKIISAKFLAPFGSTINAIRSLDYFTDLKVNRGVNIVATNNSWGAFLPFDQLLLDAVGRTADANMLFIAAAGNAANDNDGFPFYPANFDTSSVSTYDNVVSVAALADNGAIADFSSYGASTVDLGAPGVAVLSTTPFNTYSFFDGTSMAAPHVTGGAALYYAANPTATPQQIRAVLLGSAVQTPTASLNGLVYTGGRLNLTKLSAAEPPPQATATITDTILSEGDTGVVYASLTVTLSRVVTGKTTINYATANGTALAGSDYIHTTGTLTIPQGQRTGVIKVPVYGDTASEPNETFFVNLSNPVNVGLADDQGQVTIRNDDFATKVSVNDVRRLEGNTGYAAFLFTVSLSQSSTSTVTVQVATSDGSANDGMDYVGIPPAFPITLTFAPGVLTRTVTVSGIGETLFEPDETFYLDILAASNASIKKKQGLATILNDDSYIPGQPPGGGAPGTGPGNPGGIVSLSAASYYNSLQQPTSPTDTTSLTKAKKK